MKILFGELKLKSLTGENYTYLEEYLKVMKPISCYLDVLQGEKNCYLGCALPVLVKLKTKLNHLTLKTKQAETLRLGLLTQINTRYSYYFFTYFILLIIELIPFSDLVPFSTEMISFWLRQLIPCLSYIGYRRTMSHMKNAWSSLRVSFLPCPHPLCHQLANSINQFQMIPQSMISCASFLPSSREY